MVRPSPVHFIQPNEVGNMTPQDMSIIKQSLLWHDRNATASIFMVASKLNIYLSDVADCIEDL